MLEVIQLEKPLEKILLHQFYSKLPQIFHPIIPNFSMIKKKFHNFPLIMLSIIF